VNCRYHSIYRICANCGRSMLRDEVRVCLAWCGESLEPTAEPPHYVKVARIDERAFRADARASFWETRYEDLKLGLVNLLAGKHVQPSFEENAVLLALQQRLLERQKFETRRDQE